MTLALALRGSNGLVLAADSRMSGPVGSADTSIKFLQVNREIGVMTYGLTEVGYLAITKLADEVNRTTEFREIRKRIVYYSEIADVAERIFKSTFDDWVRTNKDKIPGLTRDSPQLATGFILGGYDSNETNQFRIINWASPDFVRSERPDILAAQWGIAQYVLQHAYYPEMTVRQLTKLAVFQLVETETISQTVGGPLQVATVTLESGFQKLSEKEVDTIIEENQPRFAEFRKILIDELRT
ncbi:MAG: hypothetical protein JRN62_05975 [Nitrososphaerota archaeon]|jgi:20S proteasome alpha/beta subunit|nr:hypothetical protein [Nitrososphaerota archaeon]